MSTEEVIARFKEVHGDRYDYSKVEYVNSHTKVCVGCREHGFWWIVPHNHWKGHGCKECGFLNDKGGRPRTEVMDGKKECRKCKDWVKLEDFHTIPSSGQVLSYCKECQRSYCRKYEKKRKD